MFGVLLLGLLVVIVFIFGSLLYCVSFNDWCNDLVMLFMVLVESIVQIIFLVWLVLDSIQFDIEVVNVSDDVQLCEYVSMFEYFWIMCEKICGLFFILGIGISNVQGCIISLFCVFLLLLLDFIDCDYFFYYSQNGLIVDFLSEMVNLCVVGVLIFYFICCINDCQGCMLVVVVVVLFCVFFEDFFNVVIKDKFFFILFVCEDEKFLIVIFLVYDIIVWCDIKLLVDLYLLCLFGIDVK